jgi:hypothetical protein
METKKKVQKVLHRHSMAGGGVNISHNGLLHKSQYVGIRYLISTNLCPLINILPSLCFLKNDDLKFKKKIKLNSNLD